MSKALAGKSKRGKTKMEYDIDGKLQMKYGDFTTARLFPSLEIATYEAMDIEFSSCPYMAFVVRSTPPSTNM